MKPIDRKLVSLAAVGAALLVAACGERPPVDTVQRGYRGLGMVQVSNPRMIADKEVTNVVPAPIPPVPAGGPLARDVYKNVQVLTDLSVGEFTRLMVAVTAWVSPEQGCNYCHVPGDLASDNIYTKVVSRRMFEMTRHINTTYPAHVGGTGVTCYTCHRGLPEPANVWYSGVGTAPTSMAGWRFGQNAPAPLVGLTSLPNDPFSVYLQGTGEARVAGTAALPNDVGSSKASIQHTEWTYGLMMHMSQGLGVNCTYCHNTRSFAPWDQSTPQRALAYNGIRMVRELNTNYLAPLQSAFPRDHLGPNGDAPKLNCATCHQGVFKPLYGVSMLKDYPELARKGPAAGAPAAAATAAPLVPEPVATAEMVTVYFGIDSSELHNAAPRTLETIAARMKADPKAIATISGYHSATGDAARNAELAKNRATVVQGALKAAGIADNRIVLQKPTVVQAKNAGGEDATARRVEVTVKL